MLYLLDTNTCIYIINTREFIRVQDLRIEDWIEQPH